MRNLIFIVIVSTKIYAISTFLVDRFLGKACILTFLGVPWIRALSA